MPATDRVRPAADPDSTRATPAPGRSSRAWTALTVVEVLAATAAVLLDLVVPTLVLLAMAGASLLIRREGFGSLGFHRAAPRRLVPKMLAFAAAWSVFQLAVTMPIANLVSGRRQDLSAFRDLEGNAGLLLGLLVLSWTLAAVGEELAYRGYLQTRMRQLFGGNRAGLVAAVLASSLLFGLAHTEQGVVGVAIVTMDAIFFSVLRYRYRTLWAAVLAHGFNNTIGFVAFFLGGPIHGLW
jgi:membrane protease YdiL (CAAX protease family)